MCLCVWRTQAHKPTKPRDCCAYAVKKLLHENQLPHLLFYGPPGTGKTSTILAIARQIYGPSVGNMTLELNASGGPRAWGGGEMRSSRGPRAR